MFLAIKEMRYAKLRYGLVIGIMFLIAYVVFMLSGLASGLAEEVKKVIIDWDAQEIVLSEDANKTFAASQLTRNDLAAVEGTKKHLSVYIAEPLPKEKKNQYFRVRDIGRCFFAPRNYQRKRFQSRK